MQQLHIAQEGVAGTLMGRKQDSENSLEFE